MTLPGARGTFPFGAPLHELTQVDRRPKRVFVLGVYASAVHATWFGEDGRVKVRALAVASEPEIFWTGARAAELVAGLDVPRGAGRLAAADSQLYGPSGRSLDDDYLAPLGVDRSSAWLCDLVPHACLNPNQKAAIARAYEPETARLGLPAVNLPDAERRSSPRSRPPIRRSSCSWGISRSAIGWRTCSPGARGSRASAQTPTATAACMRS